MNRGVCEFEYVDAADTVGRWGECHYRCRRCGTWRPRPWTRACGSHRQEAAVYLVDRTAEGLLWACRACDWTTFTQVNEPPDHRCGQGECKHKGEPKGTVKVECCSGVDKQLTVHACEVHGRCLPSFVCHESGLAKWRDRKPESDIYHLCCECTERESE